MSSELPSVEIKFTDEFKRRLRTLCKKYRQIQSDVQPVIEQLQAGEFVGDQIPGTSYTVFKVRVRNSDIQKGKSAGYRLIYQLESPTSIIVADLLTTPQHSLHHSPFLLVELLDASPSRSLSQVLVLQ